LPANGYIQETGDRSRKFIPVPRNANYFEAKEYHLISLLSFMHKKIQKISARNITDESLWYVPYIYNNLPTNQGSPQKLQCTMWLHIYRKQWKKEVNLELSYTLRELLMALHVT
jgi:hypothetical protein